MENLVKSKIKKLYPDADFSSLTSEELKVFINLIQDGLTKSDFSDNITQLKIIDKQYIFDQTKEPCLKLTLKAHNKNNKELFKLNCYAFDVKLENSRNDQFESICIDSWIHLMASKYKRDYCDGLSNYILAQRVRIGESIAELTSKRLREVTVLKYSIAKEETNQP